MKEQKRYNAAVYCRLSKDDDFRGGESSSITSQKDILEKYVKENGWLVHDFYIDDGYSGTNFRRPAFERMITDIEDGKVNMVITKDLSRLGRNYILTGQYTEMYFPSKGVRYIALNDNVDTINNENSIAPFVNILNEMYAKDISKKVRTAVRSKKQKGMFVGGFAPYGYQKDPQNKNRLIVEESGAAIVKRIFGMAMSDLGSKSIAAILSDDGIPTPINHRRKLLFGIEPKQTRWNAGAVMVIMRSRVYLGELVHGVWERPELNRGPAKRRPKEEWIITPNAHEPLITEETWAHVQKLINARNRPIKSNIIQLFAGFLKCEDCGLTMAYSNSQGIPQYTCSTYRRNGRRFCSCHYIRKDVLEQVVLDDIRKYSKLAKEKTEELVRHLNDQNGEKGAEKIKMLTSELERLNFRDAELDGIMKRLYTDNVSGKLSDERFSKFLADFENEQTNIRVKIDDAQKTIAEIQKTQVDTDSWVKLIRNYTKIKELDRTVLGELVDKITIGEAKEIDGQKVTDITIYYRFVGAVS